MNCSGNKLNNADSIDEIDGDLLIHGVLTVPSIITEKYNNTFVNH